MYRYRLGDMVRVDWYVNRTPSVRFIGRTDVCDLVGEKLSEAFVEVVLSQWLAVSGLSPEFAMLAPSRTVRACGYVLHLESDRAVAGSALEALDHLLSRNPQYRWARDRGQLEPVRVMPVGPGAYSRYTETLIRRGMRLGDIKPTRLSTLDCWESVFSGSRSEPRSPTSPT